MIGNKKWEKLQQEQWERFKENPRGVFSVKETKSAHVLGKIIKEKVKGICLDIGSGALPKPYYMKIAKNVRWIGIDPYKGKWNKSYEFIQGYAENLPFKMNLFDGVVFATSLEHIADPGKAVQEAYRVLKKGGLLFLWISVKHQKYHDAFHMNTFTRNDIDTYFNRFKLIEIIEIINLQKIFIYEK